MAEVTYRKTKNGRWVVCGPASVITAGATVVVTKKDGTTKQECISSIGQPFTTRGQQMVYGYPAKKSEGLGNAIGRGAGWGVPSRFNPSGWCTGRDDCMCFDCGGDM